MEGDAHFPRPAGGRARQRGQEDARRRPLHAVSQALGYTFESFEPVLIANKHSLGESMRLLLDEVDDLEARTGQRTPGQENMVAERCRRIGVAFNQLKAAQVTS